MRRRRAAFALLIDHLCNERVLGKPIKVRTARRLRFSDVKELLVRIVSLGIDPTLLPFSRVTGHLDGQIGSVSEHRYRVGRSDERASWLFEGGPSGKAREAAGSKEIASRRRIGSGSLVKQRVVRADNLLPKIKPDPSRANIDHV